MQMTGTMEEMKKLNKFCEEGEVEFADKMAVVRYWAKKKDDFNKSCLEIFGGGRVMTDSEWEMLRK